MRYPNIAHGSLFYMFIKLVKMHLIFSDNTRILYVNVSYWYVSGTTDPIKTSIKRNGLLVAASNGRAEFTEYY